MAFAMRWFRTRMAPGIGGDSRGLGNDDPRIANAWRSLQQEVDAARRSEAPKDTQKAPQTRACATCIIDAWGVR